MEDISHLSTSLTEEQREKLRRKLPSDWVARVQLIAGFGESRIRQVLRDPKKYNKEIMDAIILVAKNYQMEITAALEAQQAQIVELIAP